jgi:hypothetical protein
MVHVVEFTTTYMQFAISAYHHLSCDFESRSWQNVLDTTLCEKLCQLLAAGHGFLLIFFSEAIVKTKAPLIDPYPV